MGKREKVFLVLAIVYFLGCLLGATAVSQTIAQYIGRNGWATYNAWTFWIGLVLTVLFLAVFLARVWSRPPSAIETAFFLGCTALITVYFLKRVVLLTTELVHVPQFSILTVLFYLAFPSEAGVALTCSAAACVADEWVQSFLPGRVLDINDIFLNFVGLFLGVLLWWSLSIWRKPAY